MSGQTIDISQGKTIGTKRVEIVSVTWEQMTDLLRDPVVTNESHAEYLAMGKEDQTRLKDRPGYIVGGTFRDNLRRLPNLIERSLITLDLDHVPAGTMLDFEIDMALFGRFAFAWHTTRKHCDESPRARVVIPLSRPVTPDEYEPVARYAAAQVGIDWVAAESYRPAQAMFLPGCSQDQEFLYGEHTAPLLDPDKVLWELAGDVIDHDPDAWRDITLWPKAEGEEITQIDRKVLDDPTTKPGIIGAFNRAYDIHEAISEYLGDVYEPTGGDRYTYLQGETANGMVTYDDAFAYSHHGTDPIGGAAAQQHCYSAWDLVRVHLFGHLDKDKHKNTKPTNLPSHDSMVDLARRSPAVRAEMEVEKQSAQEAFSDFLVEEDDAQVLELLPFDEPVKPLEVFPRNQLVIRVDKLGNEQVTRVKPTLHNFQALMACYGVEFRYNEVSKENEIVMPAGCSAEGDNAEGADLAMIDHLCNLNDFSPKAAAGYLPAMFADNAYNPVAEWLDQTEWDGVDRICELTETLHVPQEEVDMRDKFLRRWLIGAMKVVLGLCHGYEHVLVLVDSQGGKGKTRWFNRLAPNEWLTDGLLLDPRDKDSVKFACSNWLVELGELDGTFRKADMAALKAFLSKGKDDIRLPYARSYSHMQRRTAFMASVNDVKFLTDDTSNRRFWPLTVEKVDFDHNIDMAQLWAQVKVLAVAGEQHFLGRDEIAVFTKHAAGFKSEDPIEQALSAMFDFDAPKTSTMTATEVAQLLGYTKPSLAEVKRCGAAVRYMLGVNKSRKSNGRDVYDLPPPRIGQQTESIRDFVVVDGGKANAQ